MRKYTIASEMRPKEGMIRVVVSRKDEIFTDGTGKQQGRGAYVPKDVKSVEDAQRNGVLEKYFNESPEKLDPVYKGVIRLVYRKEIPK